LLPPVPRSGAYSAPPGLLAGFKGPTFKGRVERKSKKNTKGRSKEERKREGKEDYNSVLTVAQGITY